MKAEIVLVGFLDPRIGDELVVGTIECKTKYSLETHLKARKIGDGFKCNWIIIWADGYRQIGFSGNGPALETPIPKRSAIKATINV